MSTLIERDSEALGPRLTGGLQILILGGLALALTTAISPTAALRGGILIKTLFIGRMVVLIAAASLFLRLSERRWSDVGLRKVKLVRFLLALPLGLIAAYAVPLLGNAIIAKLGVQAQAVDVSFFRLIRGNLGGYLFLLIPVTWGTAAFGEEMLFRGFFTDALQRLYGSSGVTGATLAVIGQAIIFGLLHSYQGPAGAAAAGAIGLGLGFVWWFTGRNLWAGIVLHGTLDTISMTGLYLGLIGPG